MILARSTDQVVTDPTRDDVQTVTEEVWSTFLGHTDPLVALGSVELDPSWSASVTVSGEWTGMIALELTATGAHHLTCGMLGLDPEQDEASDADVADAVGELVNMIGGNIKSLLPGPSRLSLPLVAAGHFAHGSGQVEVVRLSCSWLGEPVAVTVHSGRATVSRSPR